MWRQTQTRTSHRRGLALAAVLLAAAPRTTAAAVIDTYIGGGNGDGAAAVDARIDPRGMTLGGSGVNCDLYIADGRNHRVRFVSGVSGLITSLAGTGARGYGGDGGDALDAKLNLPLDVARDSAGNLYIADSNNNRIRKVTPSGRISTFAGTGATSYSGDNGLATQAALNNPNGIALGPDGAVYIADFGNNRIRRVGPAGCSPTSCIISTVAGTGVADFSGDNGPAQLATFRNPADVSFDAAGAMLIADFGNHRIRRVVGGIITTIAGGGFTGIPGEIGDGGPATRAVIRYPTQVAAASDGSLYIADSQHYRIRVVHPVTQIITTVAGNGTRGSSGDGGSAVAAALYTTVGIGVGAGGAFWLSQSTDLAASQYNRVRRVRNGTITSVVGGGLAEGGAAYDALVDPRGAVALASGGAIPDVYFADGNNNVVRFVDGATATIHTIAGTGEAGYSGDGGPAGQATLRGPHDVAVGADGSVYVADTANNAVRRIAPNGRITTVAGTGQRGSGGDGGPAVAAQLASPAGIAVDRSGRVLIADYDNHRVRRISGGVITTVAGTGQPGYGGDGGPATAALLRNPWDVEVADDGTLYISDAWNHRIRRVAGNGTIVTFAGNGLAGYTGDGVAADATRLSLPSLLSLDGQGRLYIADTLNYRIRTVDPGTHLISTVAGNGQPGVSGDGGEATAASFSQPSGVAIDPAGRALLISANDDARIRLVLFDATVAPSRTATRAPTATPIPTSTPIVEPAAVVGTLTYYANRQPVADASVILSGPSTIALRTDAQGRYVGVVPQGAWRITPAKSGDLHTAVTALDASLVLRTVAGLESLNSAQRLACDTTGDGTLSTLDAARILQLGAGLITRLPAAAACGSDWLFSPNPAPAPQQQVIPPWLGTGTCRPGAIQFDPLVGLAIAQDFDAMLLGDCTGNWTAGGAAALRRLGGGSATVELGAARRGRGARYDLALAVHSAAPFHALDLRLRYDPAASFLAAVPRAGASGALVSARGTDGRLAISLASAAPIAAAGDPVLILRFHGADPAAALDSALIDEQPALRATPR